MTQSGNRIPTDSVVPPACDEEVDGLELARLARSLWPRNTGRKKAANSASATTKARPSSAVISSNAAVAISSNEFQSPQKNPPIARPSYLDLRLAPSYVPADSGRDFLWDIFFTMLTKIRLGLLFIQVSRFLGVFFSRSGNHFPHLIKEIVGS